MKKVFAILFLLVIGFSIWCTVSYNKIVRAEEKLFAAGEKLENLCQRRADAIPSLLAGLRRAGYEGDSLFAVVASAREKAATAVPENRSAESMSAYRQIQKNLGRELDALLLSASGLEEGSYIRDIELRIEAAFSAFDDAVSEHNTVVRSFPGNFVTWIMTLKH